jgi:outer membrane lipoprotein
MRRTTGANLGGWWALFGLWIFFFAGLSGCMPPISKDVMDTVDRDLPFSRVIENPKAYIGSIILWGGVIDKFVPGPEETRLLVIQCPLDAQSHPLTDATYGEFVAHTPRSLDPLIFRRGMAITLAGEIDGVQEKELGPEEVPRPLVRVIEIHAWTERGDRFLRR